MKTPGRIDNEEFRLLPFEAHRILAAIPLHDVWAVDLPKGGQKRTILDVLKIFEDQSGGLSNPLVDLLFKTRFLIGRLLGWDRPVTANLLKEGYSPQLTPEQEARSVAWRARKIGPFQVIFGNQQEVIGEIRNATVHAFTCQALLSLPDCYRLYWAIYVAPTSRWTPLYMSAIAPFRRWIVYPALLRKFQKAWAGLQ